MTEAVRLPDPPAFPPVAGADLHPLNEADWALMRALSDDPEVVRWTTYPPGLTESAARTRLTRFLAAQSRGEAAMWSVRVGPDRVGTLGAGVAGPHTAEVFYALLAPARGRGIAFSAVSAVRDWLHSNNFTVELGILPGNAASERLAQRLGFARTRVERRPVKGVERDIVVWTEDSGSA